jgi:hypothetical protein
MSLYDYRVSCDISLEDHPFEALIMAALRQADRHNHELLTMTFPKIADEFRRRYHAPAGIIPEDTPEERGPQVAIVSYADLAAADNWDPKFWIARAQDEGDPS